MTMRYGNRGKKSRQRSFIAKEQKRARRVHSIRLGQWRAAQRRGRRPTGKFWESIPQELPGNRPGQ